MKKQRLISFLCFSFMVMAGCTGSDKHKVHNRDKHGPTDVMHYIERLTSPERIEAFQVEFVLDTLALPRDGVVADIGSGPGVFAIPLASRVPDGVVFAVDVEPLQLDALRRRLLEEGVENVVPVLASHTRPHLPPGSIDLIFLADTYHHIEDRISYFRHLRTRLRPGGMLTILEWKPGDLPVGPPPDRKLPRETRERELESAGFILERRFDRHEYHDFEIWIPTGPKTAGSS